MGGRRPPTGHRSPFDWSHDRGEPAASWFDLGEGWAGGSDVNSGYVVITPARDEERFIEHILRSMITQTLRAEEWIIVDDGSTDGTAAIVRDYADRHPWLRLITQPDRGERKLGGGVVETFNRGLENLRSDGYAFVSKLDADLSLPPNYFEFLLQRFQENHRLGIASGCTFVRRGNTLVWERNSERSSRGMMKVYRRECFEDIGGLVAELGWDVIDDYKAQFLGWETRSYRDLVVIHHRPMGSSGKGILEGRRRFGEVHYLLSSHPLYAFCSGLYRMLERPYVVGGLAVWYGYVRSFLSRKKRIAEGELKQFIRERQLERVKAAIAPSARLLGRR